MSSNNSTSLFPNYFTASLQNGELPPPFSSSEPSPTSTPRPQLVDPSASYFKLFSRAIATRTLPDPRGVSSLPKFKVPSRVVPPIHNNPIRKKNHSFRTKVRQASSTSTKPTINTSKSSDSNNTPLLHDSQKIRIEIQKKAVDLGIIQALEERSNRYSLLIPSMVNGSLLSVRQLREFLLQNNPQGNLYSEKRSKKFYAIKKILESLIEDGSLFTGFDEKGNPITPAPMDEKNVEKVSLIWAKKALALKGKKDSRREALIRTAIQTRRGVTECQPIFERVYKKEYRKIYENNLNSASGSNWILYNRSFQRLKASRSVA